MKERELRDAATCALCRQKVLENAPLPLFFRVRIEHLGVDLGAVTRQDGLAAMLGGNSALAMVMGPDREMTRSLGAWELTVCQTCALNRQTIVWEMVERAVTPKEVAGG